MININRSQLINSYTLMEWIESYVDLQQDDLMQLYVAIWSHNEAGRQLIAQSRRIWQEHGFQTAPFDDLLLQAKTGQKYDEPSTYHLREKQS